MVVQEGNLLGSGKKFAIIGSRFNEFITSKLIGGAEDCLLRHDVKQEDITVIWVPGAYEIPLIAKKAALSGRYDAVICVGAVIRGSTTHYDYVCNEVAKGIAHVSLETGIPVMFGVLKTSSKLSNALVQKRVIKVMIVLWVQSKWLTLSIKSKNCIYNTQYLMVLGVFISSKICSFNFKSD